MLTLSIVSATKILDLIEEENMCGREGRFIMDSTNHGTIPDNHCPLSGTNLPYILSLKY